MYLLKALMKRYIQKVILLIKLYIIWSLTYIGETFILESLKQDMTDFHYPILNDWGLITLCGDNQTITWNDAYVVSISP